jgi:hypothetical protein
MPIIPLTNEISIICPDTMVPGNTVSRSDGWKAIRIHVDKSPYRVNVTARISDVFMKRDEYERFVSLRNTLEGSSYRISVYLDGDSPYPFAKFHTTKGTIWEYPQFPYVIGPWIDVFPIDEGDEDDPKANKILE